MPIAHSSNSLYPPVTRQPNYPVALLIHGRVGYAYVFKQYGLRRVICKYYYPYDPKDTVVMANRRKFAYAVFYWQGFDDATKQFYNSKIYPQRMSGYNRYIHYYMLS